MQSREIKVVLFYVRLVLSLITLNIVRLILFVRFKRASNVFPQRKIVFNIPYIWNGAYYEMLLAAFLKSIGYDVSIGTCKGYIICERRTHSSGYDCSTCRLETKVCLNSLGLTEYRSSSSLGSNSSDLGSADSRTRNRFIYRNACHYSKSYSRNDHLSVNGPLGELFDNEWSTWASADADFIVTSNGKFIQTGVPLYCARLRGIPFLTLDMFSHKSLIVSDFKNVAHDLISEWEDISGLVVDEEAVQRHFYNQRSGRNLSIRLSPLLDENTLKARDSILARIRNYRSNGFKIITIYGGTVWDSTSMGMDNEIDGQDDWCKRLSEVISKTRNSNVVFVVRPHPVEQSSSIHLRTVRGLTSNLLEYVEKEDLQRTLLIPANSACTSYDLLDLSDLCLVYGSTMGAEALYAGVPVVYFGTNSISCHCPELRAVGIEDAVAKINYFLAGKGNHLLADVKRRMIQIVYYNIMRRLRYVPSLDHREFFAGAGLVDFAVRSGFKEEFGLAQQISARFVI
jgi:hypothetical protein